MNTILETKSTLQKIRESDASPKDLYKQGLIFLDETVTNNRDVMVDLYKQVYGEDLTFASSSLLKDKVKNAIKSGNKMFINGLAGYIGNPKPYKFAEISSNLRPATVPTPQTTRAIELSFKSGAFSKQEEALIKAEMEENGYNREEAIQILSSGGKLNSGSSSNATKEKEKKSFDWNSALENTGKVAQSIFFLGSIFSKNENPVPTVDMVDEKSTKNNRAAAMNIAIIVGIVAIVGLTIWLLLKKPKSAK